MTVISAEKTEPAVLALAHKALDDGKAKDIVSLDVSKLTTITDHMLIASGTSQRHVKSLAENLVKTAKDAGFRPSGVEGLAEAEWVLVDLGAVVVHVMQQQTRAFYQLEKLWSMGSAQDSTGTDQ